MPEVKKPVIKTIVPPAHQHAPDAFRGAKKVPVRVIGDEEAKSLSDRAVATVHSLREILVVRETDQREQKELRYRVVTDGKLVKVNWKVVTDGKVVYDGYNVEDAVSKYYAF